MTEHLYEFSSGFATMLAGDAPPGSAWNLVSAVINFTIAGILMHYVVLVRRQGNR